MTLDIVRGQSRSQKWAAIREYADGAIVSVISEQTSNNENIPLVALSHRTRHLAQ